MPTARAAAAWVTDGVMGVAMVVVMLFLLVREGWAGRMREVR
jgi:hypothetical protein